MKHLYALILFALCFSGSLFSQQTYDFETPATSLTFQHFGSALDGTLTGIIPNPDKSGSNTSANVGHFVKTPGAEVWTGAFANPRSLPIDATAGGTICIKVWMDHVGSASIKLEAPVGGGENWITTQPYTTPNTWQVLCYDFSALSLEDSKLPASGKIFAQLVVFFDFLETPVTADESYYFDDIVFPSGGGTEITTTILDFEEATTTTNFTYFGSTLDGSNTEIITNPNPSGINTSDNVTKFIKPAVAQVWAGAYTNPNPVRQIDLTGANKVCVNVHMDHIGNLALKFENSTSAQPNWIQQVSNTKINEWEKLCFDASLPSIEAPFQPANSVFATAVAFFDFGIAGNGTDITYYFDDLEVISGATPTDKNVNFKVNMNNYSGNFDRVFLSGQFNDWSGDSNPLQDDDLDGIWEGSITVPNGGYEYKITLDNWAKQEEFLGTEECTKTTDAFTNRVLFVGGDTDVPEFCFNSCYACGDEAKITFKLGMGTVTPNPEGVWLSGGGNFDVPGGRYKMNDADGDGVYEIVVPRRKGFSSYYAFANGPCFDFSCKENLEGLPCADPNNFNDRRLADLPSDIVISTCYGLCSDNTACTSSTDEITYANNLFALVGNPSFNGKIMINFGESNSYDKQITITNSIGQQMKNILSQEGNQSIEMDVNELNPGLYYITILSNNQTQTQKFVRL
jgi:Secretion system C-terminal sorting domain/Carbohydrate-binding module 48 (Isoamylase N-terminal domain)